MKLIRISAFSLAIVTVLAGLSYAQLATDGAAAPDLAGRPDAWRYKYHNNQWWYYHPNNTWSTWNGSAWNPYNNTNPYTAGYRGNGGTAAVTTLGTAGAAGGMSATDAVPGRSNPQMAGGGIGINGSAVGNTGGAVSVPNRGGGQLSRGSNAGRGISATDAVPGRSNPQMAGGGIGINGSPIGGTGNGPVGAGNLGAGAALNPSGNMSATDAVPGRSNPQMVGGGIGTNGSAVGGSVQTAPQGSGS